MVLEVQNLIPINEDLISSAVEKVSKSVVNIASVRMMHDQLFRIFPIQGVGSGVVIDNDGHVLTNNHVIENAQQLKITTTDGRTENGKVIGTDELTDLAVVKAGSIEKFEHAQLGDSDNLRIGQIVLAIGNPFGLSGGPTVTSGIVSSLKRSIQFDTGMLEVIQTDAAINPGNSGGPLINTNGEVVAINTAKMPYGQGIGFAIPINISKSILEDLIQNGKVTRPWMGVATVKLDQQIARYYRLPITEGALVVSVERNSPAEYAGIRRGDIIEEVNSTKISDPSELLSAIIRKKTNDHLKITINRYGRQFEIFIQIQARP
jgi:S1-C subfamily serine protease